MFEQYSKSMNDYCKQMMEDNHKNMEEIREINRKNTETLSKNMERLIDDNHRQLMEELKNDRNQSIEPLSQKIEDNGKEIDCLLYTSRCV